MPAETNQQLDLDVSWGSTNLDVGELVQADLTASYNGPGVRDQVMVRIGKAPGFTPFTEDLDAIVVSGLASRYEVDETMVTLYLMGLAGGEQRQMSVRFLPTLAAAAEAPASEIYVYYEPSIRTEVPAIPFVVNP